MKHPADGRPGRERREIVMSRSKAPGNNWRMVHDERPGPEAYDSLTHGNEVHGPVVENILLCSVDGKPDSG